MALYVLYLAWLAATMPPARPEKKRFRPSRTVRFVVKAQLLAVTILPLVATAVSGAWAAGALYFAPVLLQVGDGGQAAAICWLGHSLVHLTFAFNSPSRACRLMPAASCQHCV